MTQEAVDFEKLEINEQIDLLKKVELKFHEIVEMRKVFNFFDPEELKKNEYKIRAENKTKVTNQIIERNQRDKDKKNAEVQMRIDYKKNLVVKKNIRATERSRKPVVHNKKTKKVEEPQSVQDMRKYVGIVPDDWAAADVAPKEADANQK